MKKLENALVRQIFSAHFFRGLIPFFLSTICIFFVSGPYIFGKTKLPRIEELNYSLLPLVSWANMRSNHFDHSWYSNFGFGIPWPIPHTMNSSPFSYLFASNQPFRSLGIFLVFHVVFVVFCLWQIGRLFNFNRTVLSVLVLSVTLASQLEYLVSSDAAAAFLGWLLLPGLILGVLKISFLKSARALLAWGAFLSLTMAYGFANSHLGMFSTYLVSIAILFISLNYRNATKLVTGTCVLLTSVCTASTKLFFYFTESNKYPKNVLRNQYDYESSASHTFWSLFVKPFTLEIPRSGHLLDFIIEIIQSNQVTRVLSFGSPLVALILILGFHNTFLARKSTPNLKSPTETVITKHNLEKILWVNLVTCFMLQLVPAKFLTGLVSASWTFRDPATIYGLVLFCLYLNKFSMNRRFIHYSSIISVLHVVSVFIAGLSIIFAAAVVNNKHDWTASQYDALFASSLNNSKWEGISLIETALSCGKVNCVKFGTRVAMSGQVSNYLARGELKDSGLILNLLGSKGLQEVNAVTKGISQDLIHPSQAKYYGMITGNTYQSFGYSPNEYDWLLQNPTLRNITGVRVVLASSDQVIDLRGLSLVGRFRTDIDKTEINVYKNIGVLPKVVALSTMPVSVLNQRACTTSNGGQALTCQNILLPEPRLYPDPVIHSKKGDDGFRITMKPRKADTFLVINTMWDSSWSTNVGTLRNFHGLMLLHVPPSTKSIEMRYVQTWKTYTVFASNLGAFLTFLALLTGLLYRPLSIFHRKLKNKFDSPVS
jgi:hypothetical protein